MKHLSSQLSSQFILEVPPVTVLKKIFASVTIVQTSYLRFSHCPEPTNYSKGYDFALNKLLLILRALLNETMVPGKNTILTSWLNLSCL